MARGRWYSCRADRGECHSRGCEHRVSGQLDLIPPNRTKPLRQAAWATSGAPLMRLLAALMLCEASCFWINSRSSLRVFSAPSVSTVSVWIKLNSLCKAASRSLFSSRTWVAVATEYCRHSSLHSSQTESYIWVAPFLLISATGANKSPGWPCIANRRDGKLRKARVVTWDALMDEMSPGIASKITLSAVVALFESRELPRYARPYGSAIIACACHFGDKGTMQPLRPGNRLQHFQVIFPWPCQNLPSAGLSNTVGGWDRQRWVRRRASGWRPSEPLRVRWTWVGSEAWRAAPR
jgi:hypothetical protein